MAGGFFLKDPDTKVDYVIDWAGRLPTGDTLSVVTWSVPAGLVQTGTGLDGVRTTVWVEGGTAGATYEIGCTVTTVAGLRLQHTLVVLVDHIV